MALTKQEEAELRRMGRSAARAASEDSKPLSRQLMRVTSVKDGRATVDMGSEDMPMPLEGIPMTTGCVGVEPGDTVVVDTKGHRPLVTGVVGDPETAKVKVNKEVVEEITKLQTAVADKATVGQLDAEKARIDELIATDADIKGRLTAHKAEIDDLKATTITADQVEAKYATIERLEADTATINGKITANEGEIETLKSTKIDAEEVNANFAKVESLEATNAAVEQLTATDAEITGKLTAAEGEIGTLKAGQADVAGRLTAAEADISGKLTATEADIKYATIERLDAERARIDDLSAKKLDAEQASIRYANIDFSNIGQAAIEKLFGDSGIIGDLVMSDGKVTGTLVGVTIKGDLIEGGTVVADKLVMRGEDGLYYKLNTTGESVTSQQTDYNSLNGSVITAKSITAEKVAVDDLVAFGATIGGFSISNTSIHSGVKDSPANTTRGVYMDRDGQFSVGDQSNYLRYFLDSDGKWKLQISANAVSIGAKALDSYVDEAVDKKVADLDLHDGEDAVILQITSSNGTSFKNSSAATVLAVTVIRGGDTVTDSAALAAAFGDQARLSWREKRMGGDWQAVPPGDARLSDKGFLLAVTAGDVGSQAVFSCDLEY